jgi:hypothetical protein
MRQNSLTGTHTVVVYQCISSHGLFSCFPSRALYPATAQTLVATRNCCQRARLPVPTVSDPSCSPHMSRKCRETQEVYHSPQSPQLVLAGTFAVLQQTQGSQETAETRCSNSENPISTHAAH